MNDEDNTIRIGYVEKYIKERKEEINDAYLAIDVKSKKEYDVTSKELKKSLKNNSAWTGLHRFFEKNNNHDVYITDDDLNVEDFDLIPRFIKGKDVLVHCRVDYNNVERVKALIEKQVEEDTYDAISAIYWLDTDKEYIIHLQNSFSHIGAYSSIYFLRLYEDGNGVIIYCNDYNAQIKYFRIKDSLLSKLLVMVQDKIDYIVKNPVEWYEDDRCVSLVHLKYNVYWKYPLADKLKKKNMGFDDTEYSDDINDIKIAKLLVNASEIKDKWMRMHI